MSEETRRGRSLEELQPDYEDSSKCPKTLTKSRHIDDVFYVAGRAPVEGQTEYDVMFITVSVEEEEATTAAVSTFGFRVTQPAEYLKGAGSIIKDVAMRGGIDLDQSYYTACCKWVLPRAQRARPSKKVMKWGMPILEDEIKRVKPKIIVCLGKHVFDMVADQKIKFSDAHGCWFWSEQYNAHLYVMYAPYTLIGKPELYETFRVDFREVARRKELLDSGAEFNVQQFNYQVIRSQDELLDWLDHLETLVEEDRWPGHKDDDGNPLLAVDCEWHGRTHVDGDLRTIQFAWSENDAVVIEFRDEQNWFTFDMGEGDACGDDQLDPETARIGAKGQQLVRAGMRAVLGLGESPTAPADHLKDFKVIIPKIKGVKEWPSIEGVRKQCADDVERRKYAAVGRPIAQTLSRLNVRFIGHHYAADAPWMKHWLGIEIYEKCEMDTEFAQQTCDESSELGLERGIAMKYTTLGRYDFDLMMWKRENKKLCEGGYGYIPSKILHPYGAADVITPYRAYPMIKRQLDAQRLWDYYRDIFNPFVTDVFTEFTMTGLPMDIKTMDDLRDLFTFTKEKLAKKLQLRITLEAKQHLRSRVAAEFGISALRELVKAIDDFDEATMLNEIKKHLDHHNRLGEVNKWVAMIRHYIEAPAFNIRSPDQMRRWLFEVEGLEPIKSTNQKAAGLPSMAWEKVLELPKDRQALYTPAVDKQTMQILAEQFDTLNELLDLNAVGNLSKAFLKEPDIYIDDYGNEVREEHGLHAWLASDGYIHGQYSSTETGRPRSWCPNTLNWPSYVNKRISRSVARCVQEAYEEGDLPEILLKWVETDPDKLPSIRSCVKAPDGWVMVESDYATAEMVALGDIANDKDLQRILKEPDPEWAKLKDDNPYKAKAVRVMFAGEEVTGIPRHACNPDFIMQVWEEGTCKGPVTEDMLQRDKDGNVKHAKYDIHWSLVERTYGKCREMMKAKVERAAAKVLNFSSAYGATANSLERKIEADTGVKPEPGTGERGLEAIAARQPRATQFLEEMARVPKDKGYYRAASGRIRHCILHNAGSGVGWRMRNSLESALGREMRNYPMQESVGATSARACRWLLKTYRKLKMQARPMTCLYDSVVTLCPLEERHLVARLHQICMSEMNTWEYNDETGKRTLQYTIDNEFNWRWSTAPTEEEQEKLADPSWHPTPARLKFFDAHANLRMFVS